MRLLAIMLIVTLCLSGNLAGCTTTDNARRLALEVNKQVDDYAGDRRQVIERLNAQYRSAYVQLSDDHYRLTGYGLRLERHADAQAMADSVMLNWEKGTTHTAIINELDKRRTRQLKAIDARAKALADARKAYAEGYSELQLQFKELTNAQKLLLQLSQKEDARIATTRFLIQLAEIYNEVRNEIKKEEEGE